MPKIDKPPPQNNSQQADRVAVFRARAWARALLVEHGYCDRQDSLLILERAALDYGLLDLEEDVAAQIINEEFGS